MFRLGFVFAVETGTPTLHVQDADDHGGNSENDSVVFMVCVLSFWLVVDSFSDIQRPSY